MRPLFKQIEICSGMLTAYFNRKYFPSYTRKLQECLLLGISPSGRNPRVLRGQNDGDMKSNINSANQKETADRLS